MALSQQGIGVSSIQRLLKLSKFSPVCHGSDIMKFDRYPYKWILIIFKIKPFPSEIINKILHMDSISGTELKSYLSNT